MRLWGALLAVLVSGGARPQGQTPPAPEYIAFRVADDRLIATVLVRDGVPPQITEGLAPRPPARYGYPHFALPTWWRDRQPFVVPSTTRWSVHLSPGHVIQAVAGDVVGGYAGCE